MDDSPEVAAGAIFDPSRRYRYRLWRTIDPFAVERRICLFAMLNPSTADEYVLDPTVRRCVSFAKDWGVFSRVDVVNIFAFRATDPRALLNEPDPVGVDNDRHIEQAAIEAELIICAWGVYGTLHGRARHVLAALANNPALRPKLHALGETASGQPKHPLYVRADTPLISYTLDNLNPDRRAGRRRI